MLPQSPTDEEKYLYVNTNSTIIFIFSIISFTGITISTGLFLSHHTNLWPLYGYFALTVFYFIISLSTKTNQSFNKAYHDKIINKWKDRMYASVDVFLPTAGESLTVLENTWQGVAKMMKEYNGTVTVFCLDDSARPSVRALAKRFNFYYKVRPNRGEFKKAGNLRFGYTNSYSEYIIIFDADFRPRADFISEMLPYFYENPSIGLVQSPQYFSVDSKQNWLERGAGAVQEYFYRYSQVYRQNLDASICVGSNAMYRRAALDTIGGTALVEHSEDVHTGFNLRTKGWTIQYIPIILAKGLCPSDMQAFFKQQYRWCSGSLSLLTSRKFWKLKLSLRSRLCYFSGFFFYIHTAVSSIIVPMLPLIIIFLYPNEVSLHYVYLLLPSIIFVFVVYPLWHNATYGIEAWSTRSVYGWAHLFALFDLFTKKSMKWQPTGSKMSKDIRYRSFRISQMVFNLIPGIIWVSYSLYYIVDKHNPNFIPFFFSGVYFLLITSKVSFYGLKKQKMIFQPVYITPDDDLMESSTL